MMYATPLLLALTDPARGLLADGLIAGTAVICLLLLRGARFPISGRAVIAGSLAGLLLGPTILGRVVPEQYENLFVGGAKEQAALDYARWFAANAPMALKDLTSEVRAAQQDQFQRDIAAKELALTQARWRQQQSLRVFALSIIALTLLASATQSPRGKAIATDPRQNWITLASVAIWSFALPAGMTYSIAMRWWDVSISEAAMLAAAVGIGPWVLSALERDIADAAEVGGAWMMQTAGRVASSLAVVLAAWAMWTSRGIEGIALAAALLALPAAWFAARSIGAQSPHAADLKSQISNLRFQDFAIESLLAILAALVAIKVDVHAQFAWQPLITLALLALLADDGRWLGAFLGVMLPGGRSGGAALRSMRLVMPAMAAGPTQLAVAALGLWCGVIEDRFALPLLAGAILIETTAPARRTMARKLIETEQEIDKPSFE